MSIELFRARIFAEARKSPTSIFNRIRPKVRDLLLEKMQGQIIGYGKSPTEDEINSIPLSALLENFERQAREFPQTFGPPVGDGANRLDEANKAIAKASERKPATPENKPKNAAERAWLAALPPDQRMAFSAGTLKAPPHLTKQEPAS